MVLRRLSCSDGFAREMLQAARPIPEPEYDPLAQCVLHPAAVVPRPTPDDDVLCRSVVGGEQFGDRLWAVPIRYLWEPS